MGDIESQKQSLIESLKEQGFSRVILNAFSKVRREDFIPKSLKARAYENVPLPIGKMQTISQPYTIAMMLKMLNLRKGQKVLEIGSGCGYVLALLSEILGEKSRIFGVEIVKDLAEKSKNYLKGNNNIEVYNRNGNLGLDEEKPFDRVLISARTENVPERLVGQLKSRGLIVAPIGNSYGQSLTAYRKEKNRLKIIKEIHGFAFVPLVE